LSETGILRNFIKSSLIIICIGINSVSQAAESLYKLSLEELLALKISTATKRSESIIETPAPVRVLTKDDINRLGFSGLEQTLNYITGVSHNNGEGNIFTTFTIRGNTLVNFNTNTLVMLNGVPFYSPYHGSFDLSMIPLILIERIEMIPGAQSVFYGTNAINAVINIISKSAQTVNNETKLRYGSFQDYQLTSLHQFEAFSGRADVAIDFNGRDGENQRLMDESGAQLYLNDALDNAAVSIGWRNDDFQIRLNQYQRKLPNYRTRSFSTLQKNTESGWVLSAKHVHKNALGQIDSQISLQNWELTKIFLPLDNSPAFDWDYSGDMIDLQIEQQFEFSEMNAGTFGVNLNRGKARRYKEDESTFDIGLFDQPTDSIAIYWNGDYEVDDKNKFYYGTRYYESRFDDKNKNETVKFSDLSPRVGLVHIIDKSLSLKFLYAEAFRVPSYFEKQVSSDQVLGNADLQPETSESIDLVLSWVHDNWQIEFNPFLMTINDKITRVDLAVPVTDPDFGKRQNQNVGAVETRGIETNARFVYEDIASGFFGIGWYQGKNKTLDADLPFTYSNMVQGAISLPLNDGQ